MTAVNDEAAEREVIELAFAVCDGVASDRQIERIEQLLAANPAARLLYLQCMELHLGMDRRASALPAREELEAPRRQLPADTPLPLVVDVTGPAQYGFPTNAFVPGSLLFSYGLATAIIAAGLLVAWACKLYVPGEAVEVAHHAASEASPQSPPATVARIVDMIACRWADAKIAASEGDRIALGQKYALASGLVQIAYDSGATVILQGPCNYEVRSPAAGYLSYGRLTARVEKKAPSSLAPRPSPLFSVHTPTAVVTDLGTEFAVQVDKSGASQTRVFRGNVQVRATAGAGSPAVVLGENESAHVDVGQRSVAKVVREPGERHTFIREMPKAVPVKLFNTGQGLSPGDRDPHWQVVSRSDDPHFKPRPATVVAPVPSNGADRPPIRQWISPAANVYQPDDVVFVYRTTFDLTGMLPLRATLRGRFIADDKVVAIRLNGHRLKVPLQREGEPFDSWSRFAASTGFVSGLNILEVEVLNADQRVSPSERHVRKNTSPTYCIVELEGEAIPDPGLGGGDSEKLPAPPKPREMDELRQ